MIRDRAIFADRAEAGKRLGALLKRQTKYFRPLVLGIPTGGVQVAYEVAEILKGDLSVVVAKKLADPANEELALGAMAEGDFVYSTRQWENLGEPLKRSITRRQSAEIERRIECFRGGRPLPEMAGRVVVIVDDGIATGATIAAAIQVCKTKDPERIIVAAPVASNHDFSNIFRDVDQLVIVKKPQVFRAVGAYYQDFCNLSDEKILALIRKDA